MNELQEYVAARLEMVEQLEEEVMRIVRQHYSIGAGHVQRGKFHTFLYNEMGFHGRYGNNFARFICRTMQKNGFRVGWRRGKKVIYGLSCI